ncbi:MAG: hypothetical protein ACI8RC_002341 [Ilumatobacter sp.]|jgi:hypothetical protein
MHKIANPPNAQPRNLPVACVTTPFEMEVK